MLNIKKSFAGKMLSFFLSMLIIAMSASMAFASEQTVLTEANVVTWPTLEGTLYFTQKIGDALTISGGLVTTDGTETGTQIPGHFEFVDSSFVPSYDSVAKKADIKFVPDDSETYTGFTISSCENVTYRVNRVTPVLADENDPPVASAIETAGSRLATSTLSGGAVKNPFTGEVFTPEWYWVSGRTRVNESGYFTAEVGVGLAGYGVLTMDVYVSIAGDAPATKVEILPSFGEVYYAPNLTLGDLTLTGGKAVVSETGEEIEGTFAVADDAKKISLTAGERTVPVLFTPSDSTQGITCICQVPVTVKKAAPKFKADDESGIPTITMPYGAKLDSSLDYKITPLVDVDAPVYLSYKDMNGEEFSYSGTIPVVGTHEIQVKVNVQDSNYEKYTMLTFKLEITGFESSCIVVPIGSEGYKIIDEGIAYNVSKPTGTFTVSYTVNGEKQPDFTVKYGELFQVDKVKSGNYVFTVTYNQIENDPFSVEVKTFETEEKLERNVKIGDINKKYTYGDTVTVAASATDPAYPDKPYYGFTGWEVKGNIGLSDEELANTEISFAMPDEDVELNATYKFSLKLFFEWIWQQIVQFFTFIINAVKDLFALAAA